MTDPRLEALRAWLADPEADRIEVSISREAHAALRRLVAAGFIGKTPEVEAFVAGRLLEETIEALGDDPKEGLMKAPAKDLSPPAVGHHAPDATVLDVGGNAVALADVWRRQTTALVFLRHYG
jgi:hypothetical protein